MSIDLGIPIMPPPTLADRRKTRQFRVGKVLVGEDAPKTLEGMQLQDRSHWSGRFPAVLRAQLRVDLALG
jgi:hypothetical protein